jgi:hypothetical protein
MRIHAIPGTDEVRMQLSDTSASSTTSISMEKVDVHS